MRIRHAAFAAAVAMATIFTNPPVVAQTSGGQSGQFIAQAPENQWRASKLVGLNVYDPKNEKIGSIREILMGKDGNAEAIVIGVGGFLGIGSKDVALPFKAVKWSEEPIPVTLPSETTGVGPGLNPAPSSPAMPPPQQVRRDFPDHAVLDMSKDQLKNAPEFRFASAAATAPGTNGAPSKRNR